MLAQPGDEKEVFRTRSVEINYAGCDSPEGGVDRMRVLGDRDEELVVVKHGRLRVALVCEHERSAGQRPQEKKRDGGRVSLLTVLHALPPKLEPVGSSKVDSFVVVELDARERQVSDNDYLGESNSTVTIDSRPG